MTDFVYTDILGACLSLLTGGMSIVIAIFTLSVAAIISKRDIRNELEQQIEDGGVSLTLMRKINAASNFINRMRRITNNCIAACIVYVIGIIAYIVFRCVNPTCWIMCLVGIVGVCMVYTLYVIYLLFKWYIRADKS